VLLRLLRARFEKCLAGRDERTGVLQRRVGLLLRGRRHVGGLLEDRLLQLLRFRDALFDERRGLLEAFLRGLGRDLLELLCLLDRFGEEIHGHGLGSPTAPRPRRAR